MITKVHLPIASIKGVGANTQKAIDEGLNRLNSLLGDDGKIIAQYQVHTGENIPYEIVFLVHKPDPQEIGYAQADVDWS